MVDLELPESPYEIERLMREISLLLNAAADPSVQPVPAHPRVLTGIKIEDLLARLHIADETKHSAPSYVIRSHRPVIGRIFDLVKKSILWAVKPQLSQIAEKQETHNEAMLTLQHALIGTVEELTRTNDALGRKLRQSEDHLRAARGKFDQMRGILDSARAQYELPLRSHQEALGKAVRELTGTQEKLGQKLERTEGQLRAALDKLEQLRGHLDRTVSRYDPTLQSHQDALGGIRDELTKIHESLNQQKARSENQIHETLDKLEQLRGHLDSTALRFDLELRSHQDALGGIRNELTGTHEALDQHMARSEDQIQETHGKFDRLRGDLDNTASRFDLALRSHEDDLGGIRNELTKTHEALDQHMARSEDQIRKTGVRFDQLDGLLKQTASRHDLTPFFARLDVAERLSLMNRTRGPRELILERFAEYLDMFRDRPGDVVDIGCGRGEFLEHLRGAGITGWGCDLDPAMVAACRELQLDARLVGVMEALHSVPPASLGGVFCAQVIEHLFPGDLLDFIQIARERIAPGGVICLESLNPQTLGVLACSYYRDLEHKQPVDPEYLSLLMNAAGFENVRWMGKHPFPDSETLQLPPLAEMPGVTRQTHEALQLVLDRVNRQIWGAQDYCIIGEVPRAAKP